ncbi:MAG: hypothetical protein FWB95_04105 [Treponema sp.]|nr:hypothetical protein [Treponema sp.]
MKSKYILYTILLILIGSGSFLFGLISCQTANSASAGEEQVSGGAKQETQTSVLPKTRGSVSSLLIPDIDSEKGTQKPLFDKTNQILKVWTSLKTMNGVINVMQSAQVRGNYFIESSVNPVEFLTPFESALGKVSAMILRAFSVITFQKVLLSIAGYLVFLILIPLCVLIALIILWTHEDKTKLHRIFISSVLVSIIIPLAIPASIQVSSLLGNKIMANEINTLVASIEEKGKTAKTMEDDITRTRRTGNSIINFMPRVRDLSDSMIDDAVKYYIIFLFINIIFPILALLIIFFLTRYVVRLILGK